MRSQSQRRSSRLHARLGKSVSSIESLESRQLLSGTPIPDGISLSKGILYINTGATDDVAVVTIKNGKVDVHLSRTTIKVIQGTPIRLTVNDPEKMYDPASVTKIEAFLTDGNDSFTNSTAIPSYASGGNGDDVLNGGTGKDSFYGGAGDDVLSGGSGNDYLSGDIGDDSFIGGDGNDSIVCGDGNDTASGGTGDDSITGGNGNDSLSGDDGNDSITGDGGNDVLVGGAGNDSLTGGTGNDSLQGDGGNDILVGGSGNDTYRFAGTLLGVDTITEASNVDEDTLDFSKFGSGGIIIPLSGNTPTTSGGTTQTSASAMGPMAIPQIPVQPISGLKSGVELDTHLSFTTLAQQGGRVLSSFIFTGGVNVDLTKLVQTPNSGNIALKFTNANSIEDVVGSAFADTIKGNSRTNHISGGGSDDNLFAGTGRAFLDGGSGDDTLMTIGGSTSDQLTGGAGSDSFWCDSNSTEKITDATSAEILAGHVHRVGGFSSYNVGLVHISAPSKQRLGQSFTDPLTQAGDTVHYSNFGSDPLFAPDGPSPNDIFQGSIGDCYFLSMLSGLAKNYPDAIRQTIADLGDGTFAVDMHTSLGTSIYLRIDGDLPVWNGTPELAYAGLGHGNSLWAAIIEKAWAIYRNNSGKYGDINGGNNPGIAQNLAFHLSEQDFPNWPPDSSTPGIFSTADQFMSAIYTQVKAGKAITIGGPVNWEKETVTGARRGQHIYMVSSVQTDRNGKPVTLVLRNPWGSTGPKDDGYIYISKALAFGRSGGFAVYTPLPGGLI